MRKRERPDDRLGLARNLLVTSWLVSGIVLALMLLDSNLRPSPREGPAHALVEDLCLSNLSVLPAGRALRNPEALHEAVELRFSPLLPSVETEPAGLLLTGPGLSVDRFRR